MLRPRSAKSRLARENTAIEMRWPFELRDGKSRRAQERALSEISPLAKIRVAELGGCMKLRIVKAHISFETDLLIASLGYFRRSEIRFSWKYEAGEIGGVLKYVTGKIRKRIVEPAPGGLVLTEISANAPYARPFPIGDIF